MNERTDFCLEFKVEELKKYYGLRFVTSSLEKKAEAGEIRSKLDVDSTRPRAAPACEAAAATTSGRSRGGRSGRTWPTRWPRRPRPTSTRARAALVRRRRRAAAAGGGRRAWPALQLRRGGVRGGVDGDGGGGRRGRGAAGGRARPALAAVLAVRVVRLRRG